MKYFVFIEDTKELLQDLRRFRREKQELQLQARQQKEDLYENNYQDTTTVTPHLRDKIIMKIRHQVWLQAIQIIFATNELSLKARLKAEGLLVLALLWKWVGCHFARNCSSFLHSPSWTENEHETRLEMDNKCMYMVLPNPLVGEAKMGRFSKKSSSKKRKRTHELWLYAHKK